MTSRVFGLLSWILLVASDVACLMALMGSSGALREAWPFLAMHAGIAITVGLVTLFVVPPQGPAAQRRTAVLVGVLACFVPVIGPIGALACIAAAQRGFAAPVEGGWVTLPLQDDGDARFESANPRAEESAGFSSVSALLLDRRPEVLDRRLGWLLGSRKLPARDAVALLKLALSDPADEVRLFAFTRLERWRTDLETEVRRLKEALGAAGDAGARLHLGIAEAYWELAYFGLVEGAVRDHALFAALENVDRACAANPSAGPPRFLRGRILMQRGEYQKACDAFEQALALEHPPIKLLPYLAECAFRERDFGRVRSIIRSFDEYAPGHAALRPVVDLWR